MSKGIKAKSASAALVKLDARECTIIRVALRLFQESYGQHAMADIRAVTGGELPHPSAHDIDVLCERFTPEQLKTTIQATEVASVLAQVADTFYQLADNAGDVGEWNKGGHAFEASAAVRKLRKKFPTA